MTTTKTIPAIIAPNIAGLLLIKVWIPSGFDGALVVMVLEFEDVASRDAIRGGRDDDQAHLACKLYFTVLPKHSCSILRFRRDETKTKQ